MHTELEGPQQKFVTELLKGGDELKLTATIPEDAEPEKILSTLDVCCGTLVRLDALGDAIKPVIGRLLGIIQTRALYRPEYQSFDQFLTEHVVHKLKMSRSNLFEAKRIARAFPNLPIAEYQEIGATKLLVASHFTNQEDSSKFRRILTQAKKTTVEGFKSWAVEQGLIESGQTQGERIVISTNKSIAKRWEKWVSMAEVQEWAGSTDPGKILEAMMAEVSTEVGRAAAAKS
jgi:hypothetical protein